jgi:hypothetical protein
LEGEGIKTSAAVQSKSAVVGSSLKKVGSRNSRSASTNDSESDGEAATYAIEENAASGSLNANSAAQRNSPQRVDTSYESSSESVNDYKQTWPSDAQGISSAVGESLSEINDCYSAWLAAETTKNLVGEIIIAFTLQSDPSDATKGKITEARVLSSQLNNKLLEACALSVVSALKFDPPQEKMVIEYPFRFSKE